MRKAVVTLLMATIICGGSALAQIAPDGARYASPPKVSHPLPFRVGETLSYDVSFSKFIFGGDVAELTITVSKAEQAKTELLELKADLQTKGFFPKLFGVKVNDKYISLINPTDLGLHSSTKRVEEGKLRKEFISVVDRQAGRVTYTERDLADAKAAPQTRETAAPAWVHDTLSALYFARTQKLAEGDVMPIPLTDYGQIFNIEIVVGKREEVKVDAGRFKTVMLEAKIFDGRYLRRSGQMFIWVTDDDRRIPVRARIKTSDATINIDLKRMS